MSEITPPACARLDDGDEGKLTAVELFALVKFVAGEAPRHGYTFREAADHCVSDNRWREVVALAAAAWHTGVSIDRIAERDGGPA
jgi:hypothetical protein